MLFNSPQSFADLAYIFVHCGQLSIHLTMQNTDLVFLSHLSHSPLLIYQSGIAAISSAVVAAFICPRSVRAC